MRNKADQFRANAAECDNLADQAKDEDVKRRLRKATDDWRKLAEKAQRDGW
jgi:hypothetical protein